MNDPVMRIAQRVFRSVKKSIPDARLFVKGKTNHNGSDFTINDRVVGDIITFRITNVAPNEWQCRVIKIDLSKLPPVRRINTIPKTLAKFLEKNNQLGWRQDLGPAPKMGEEI